MKATAARAPILLYAPVEHSLGGGVLLSGLIAALPAGSLVLSSRTNDLNELPPGVEFQEVGRGTGRLLVEAHLKQLSHQFDLCICTTGLPPLFRLNCHTAVLVQNRLLCATTDELHRAGMQTSRLSIKRTYLRRLWRNADRFIVQSNSMAALLLEFLGPQAEGLIESAPFVDLPPANNVASINSEAFDFIYVASLEPHKNHHRLLNSWNLLALEGCRPSLALTLSDADWRKVESMISAARVDRLRVRNVGLLRHGELLSLYRRCRALVYPSLVESLGLPLLEASRVGLPILAGELDYVRDVCRPAETFDPFSEVSIARAVMRFSGHEPETVQKTKTSAEFLRALQNT